MKCPYCGAENCDYLGIADGCGDYGDELCEEWRCNVCQQEFEGMCEGDFYASDESPDTDPF